MPNIRFFMVSFLLMFALACTRSAITRDRDVGVGTMAAIGTEIAGTAAAANWVAASDGTPLPMPEMEVLISGDLFDFPLVEKCFSGGEAFEILVTINKLSEPRYSTTRQLRFRVERVVGNNAEVRNEGDTSLSAFKGGQHQYLDLKIVEELDYPNLFTAPIFTYLKVRGGKACFIQGENKMFYP